MDPWQPPGGCPAARESETAELTFDGVAYIVTVRCLGGDTLEVVVEHKADASTWAAAFAAKYVEEIAAKTGSFKRFPVFVKMLLSALRQESDSVFVDLLTYADLELLRSKRASGSAGPTGAPGAAGTAAAQLQAGVATQPGLPPAHHNKRYLILTYAAEFDRVHYPLPLQFEEHPDPVRLKATIRQLRAQLAAVARPGSTGLGWRSSGGPATSSPAVAAELRQLREENAALKAQLAAALEAGGSSAASLAADMQALTADAQETVRDLRALRRERDALLVRAQKAEAALEGERNLHRRELRRRSKEVSDAEAELGAAKEQIRELRLKCRELTQELDLAQRRATVANLSVAARQPAPAGRAPYGSSGASARGGPGQSRGISPAGSRYHSRDASPAPVRRAPLPGPPSRSRSADVSRPSSRPTSRPSSAGRFDPTEYIKLKKEREREAARRLDDLRRAARLQSPGGSRGGSLAGSRPPSMPSSRHSTPQRSRMPSRDPSADRARRERLFLGSDPRERNAAVRSTERLRAAVSTTTPRAAARAFPPREQRAASPGRALLEVRERLQQYAHKQAGSSSGAAVGWASSSGGQGAGHQSPEAAQQRQQAAAEQAHRPRVPVTGDHYADATAEIADIDSRLQSLQNFLRSAKAGQPASVPA